MTADEFLAWHLSHELEPFENVRPWPRGPMEANACHTNACAIAVVMPEYRMILGRATCDGHEVDHSWVADWEGIAFEVTWPAPGTGYRGLEVDAHAFARRLAMDSVGGRLQSGRQMIDIFRARLGI